MISDKLLGNMSTMHTHKSVVKVPFEWFETEKKRISKVATDGMQIGVCIGDTLNDGDIIGETEENVYVVEILPSRLIKVTVNSMHEMGKLCFELGNRHLSLKITDSYVTIPYDEPTFEYIKKLGFNAQDVLEKFSDYIQCKAHEVSHSHIHEHDHSHNHNI